MLRALPARCQLNPVLSRSFLTTKCQRSPNRGLDPEELKSWLRTKKDETRRRAGEAAQNAFANLALLGGKLNKISGYEDIEALKSKVTACEDRIRDSREVAKLAKSTYEVAVLKRSQSQKEVNDLLHRKSSWDDKDVLRFTSLVREDHGYEQEESRAKEGVLLSEQGVDTAFDDLLRAILSRYHEEQVWSDKIRSASTYGSLAVLALNLVVFVLAILIVEPWKRRRLAQTFEKRIEELSDETRLLVGRGIQDLLEHIHRQEGLLNTMGEILPKQSAGSEPVIEPVTDTMSPESDSLKAFVYAHQHTLLGIGWAVLGGMSSYGVQLLLR